MLLSLLYPASIPDRIALGYVGKVDRIAVVAVGYVGKVVEAVPSVVRAFFVEKGKNCGERKKIADREMVFFWHYP